MKNEQVVLGWLLDMYTDPRDGLVLWLLEEDEDNPDGGRRIRLTQPFPITFYAAGPN